MVRRGWELPDDVKAELDREAAAVEALEEEEEEEEPAEEKREEKVELAPAC